VNTILILAIAPAFAQQHSPTVDVCRADEAVWAADAVGNQTYKTLPYNELALRQNEMNDCAKVDGDQHRTADYVALVSLYENLIEVRMTHFLNRHNLMQQFLDEDAAGQ